MITQPIFSITPALPFSAQRVEVGTLIHLSVHPVELFLSYLWAKSLCQLPGGEGVWVGLSHRSFIPSVLT